MHPVLFRIGSHPIYSYGVMIALAVTAAVLVARWHLKSRFIDTYAAYDIALAAILGGVVGARLFYVIGNWSEYASNPLQLLKFWDLQGLVFYGGLAGGTVAVLLVIRWKHLPLWTMADAVALALPLGQAIGRIGCFLNGDSFGKASGLPWAVTFPQETRNAMGIAAARVHPVQLYELLLDLGLFVFLLTYRHREHQEGTLLLLYLVGYGSIRFFLEFYRAHGSAIAGITFQIMSLLLVLLGGVLFIFRRRLLPALR